MPAKRGDRDPLFGTRWVHMFEEDSADGAVYRPESDDVPLSRRVRERFELRRDGGGRAFMGGPDDRLVEQPVTWRDEGGGLVVYSQAGDPAFRIVDRSPTRLVVRRAKPAR